MGTVLAMWLCLGSALSDSGHDAAVAPPAEVVTFEGRVLADWIQDLRSGDEKTRWKAVRAFRRMGPDK